MHQQFSQYSFQGRIIPRVLVLLTFISELNAIKAFDDYYDLFGRNRTLEDYCPTEEDPTSKLCEKHTLCVYGEKYYNELSSNCHEGINFKLTKPIIEMILEYVNTGRAKISTGQLDTTNTSSIPKGFGLKYVKWDNQLGTLAKITANQCKFEKDSCRSTYKFPNATQMIGIVRYPEPEVRSVSWKLRPPAMDALRSSGRRIPRLQYDFPMRVDAVVSLILNFWARGRSQNTPEEVESFRDYSVMPYSKKEHIVKFLQLVYGLLNRVGCGITLFTELANVTTNKSKRKNRALLLVCNFSSGPVIGQPVYITTMNDTAASSACPLGYLDRDGLCVEKDLDEPVEVTTEQTTIKSTTKRLKLGEPIHIMIEQELLRKSCSNSRGDCGPDSQKQVPRGPLKVFFGRVSTGKVDSNEVHLSDSGQTQTTTNYKSLQVDVTAASPNPNNTFDTLALQLDEQSTIS